MPGTTARGATVLAISVGILMAANYTNHAALMPVLIPELGINPALGGLLSTGLFASATTISIASGAWSDRFGARRVVAAGMAVLAGSNLLLYLTPGYGFLLAVKVLQGLGTGACFVGGARFAEAVAPPGRAHLLQGLFGGFGQLGGGIGLYGVPLLLNWLSWRETFTVLGLLQAAFLFLWWLWAPMAAHPRPRARGGIGAALGQRDAWLAALLHCTGFGTAYVVSTWINTLLVLRYGLTLGLAGALGSMVLVSGLVARPLGGWLASAGILSDRRLLRLSNAFAAAGVGLLAWPSLGLGWAIAAIAVAGVGVNLSYSAVFATAAAASPDHPGAVQGLVSTLANGFVLVGAPLVGWSLGLSGEFSLGFSALAALSLLGYAAVGWVGLSKG